MWSLRQSVTSPLCAASWRGRRMRKKRKRRKRRKGDHTKTRGKYSLARVKSDILSFISLFCDISQIYLPFKLCESYFFRWNIFPLITVVTFVTNTGSEDNARSVWLVHFVRQHQTAQQFASFHSMPICHFYLNYKSELSSKPSECCNLGHGSLPLTICCPNSHNAIPYSC